ncbi:hypothetical protein SARC_07662 [Sphaeroforma arctica JP610]|uniref:Uncharacterized protein n=1 Tax=Sphaeroforma arctica JP610 TaxID=667725 RepID=A0A0L0FTE3_9EUKA|nr:hypothetical protein SARC_07662 [Sphaeroforma arctica JP610]KNC79964.1 hypothetical protein SARC_07662 [Sphaeroforma arctica JP610]|eukprot:XP_014153866.1 hypothetical protein SARC_07662 [Sphaeroforma arctica JP610]
MSSIDQGFLHTPTVRQNSCMELRRALKTTSQSTATSKSSATTPLGTRKDRDAFRRSISHVMFNQGDLDTANATASTNHESQSSGTSSGGGHSRLFQRSQSFLSRRRSLSHGRDFNIQRQRSFISQTSDGSTQNTPHGIRNAQGADSGGSAGASLSGSNKSQTSFGQKSSANFSQIVGGDHSKASDSSKDWNGRSSTKKSLVNKKHGRRAAPPTHRILVCGAPGVGKTTISKKFVYGVTDMEDSCMDEENYYKAMAVDGTQLRLQVSDISASLEEIDELVCYMQLCDGFLVVCSLADLKSVQYAETCINQIHLYNGTDCPVFLIANKADMMEDGDHRVRNEAAQLSRKYRVKMVETASLTRRNASFFYDLLRWFLYGSLGRAPIKNRKRSASVRTTKSEQKLSETSFLSTNTTSNHTSPAARTTSLADLKEMINTTMAKQAVNQPANGLRRSHSDSDLCSQKDRTLHMIEDVDDTPLGGENSSKDKAKSFKSHLGQNSCNFKTLTPKKKKRSSRSRSVNNTPEIEKKDTSRLGEWGSFRAIQRDSNLAMQLKELEEIDTQNNFSTIDTLRRSFRRQGSSALLSLSPTTRSSSTRRKTPLDRHTSAYGTNNAMNSDLEHGADLSTISAPAQISADDDTGKPLNRDKRGSRGRSIKRSLSSDRIKNLLGGSRVQPDRARSEGRPVDDADSKCVSEDGVKEGTVSSSLSGTVEFGYEVEAETDAPLDVRSPEERVCRRTPSFNGRRNTLYTLDSVGVSGGDDNGASNGELNDQSTDKLSVIRSNSGSCNQASVVAEKPKLAPYRLRSESMDAIVVDSAARDTVDTNCESVNEGQSLQAPKSDGLPRRRSSIRLLKDLFKAGDSGKDRPTMVETESKDSFTARLSAANDSVDNGVDLGLRHAKASESATDDRPDAIPITQSAPSAVTSTRIKDGSDGGAEQTKRQNVSAHAQHGKTPPLKRRGSIHKIKDMMKTRGKKKGAAGEVHGDNSSDHDSGGVNTTHLTTTTGGD